MRNMFYSFFFPLQFSYVGNHPQEDLIKFGYWLDMKIKKFKSPLLFGYMLETVVKVWQF
jgi:hypothetical protein